MITDRWVEQPQLTPVRRRHVPRARVGYHKIRPEERLMSVDLWYELYEDCHVQERYHEGSEVYVHFPDGIGLLLEENGYEVEAWYGGHDRCSFDDTSEMMVVVSRPV